MNKINEIESFLGLKETRLSGDYYCVFQIYDVMGNVYYSNLEKIN